MVLPNGVREPLDALSREILSTVDGRVPAVDLAATVTAHCPAVTPQQVLQALTTLRRKGWLIWRFELSPTVRPETELRAFLEGLDPAVGRPALARLDVLEQARDAVTDAFLDERRLGPALASLDEVFVKATGSAATRNDGQTYGGRTLVYPECRRDLAASFGPDLVDAMAPLALILDSIRWLLHQVGQSVLALIRAAHDDLVARGHHTPNATMLWTACTAMLGGQLRTVVEQALAELHRRWRSVLRVPVGARSAELRLADIRQAVADAFAAPPAGWSGARWCSPDLMVAAQSEEAFREGRYRLVLGEVHAAVNTVDYGSMVPLHRRPHELMACLDADHPQPRLLVALPREGRPRLNPRLHPALVRDTDHRLVVMPHVPVPVRGQVQLGADVPVLSGPDGLYLRLPDGSRFGVLDLFANAIGGEVAQVFDLYPAGYRPRIVVDRMVIARERWWLRAADLGFATLPDEAERFVACRAWQRRNRLPRRIFVKSPLEAKPFYVDFASPAYVELLVTAARRAAREGTEVHLGVTEMLPDLDETWLTDAAARRYVAELRFVAFDTRSARADFYPAQAPGPPVGADPAQETD
ncbi:lantibiotic dehydratase [Phytohabitans suffuscus]